MKEITALCDKIIELDEAHKKRPYAYTGDFYDECENHAAKLARALKVAIDAMEHTYPNKFLEGVNEFNRVKLKEIEDIFK